MTKNGRILIIDDEVEIRKMLKVALTAHGYEIIEAKKGQEGIDQTALLQPDLVILDIGLPDLNGFEVIYNLREWSQVPIIILSVQDQENDKIKALDAGADDYVTKPFSMGELLARMRVALRHTSKNENEPILTFGDLTIDLAHRQVTLDNQEVKLTPTEYDILKQLALHAGRVLTHKQLLRSIWGINYQGESHYLRVYIGQLRKKLETNPTIPKLIITEPGVGYRLIP